MKPVEHHLKTWPEFFRAVRDNEKTFEVRKADRPFQVGDILVLQCYDPARGTFNGQEERRRISYILPGGSLGIEEGYVVLGMKEILDTP